MDHPTHSRSTQRGFILISSLLLLVIVTLLAVAMFRGFGLDEKIAGNTREKQVALQAAVSAEQFAEWWLAVGNTINVTTCTGLVTAPASMQLCSNTLPSVVTNVALVPWKNSGTPVGVTYTPPGINVQTTNITAGTSYANPVLYVSYLGPGTGSNGQPGVLFQIDSVGYGGSPNTTAVVEATYILQTADQDLGANP